jgi:hypothetical protein
MFLRLKPETFWQRMKADLGRLVARAETLNTLWPWQGPIPEVQLVVRHGKAVAPSLLALLADDPDDDTVDPVMNWRLQQQVALALCQLYGVPAECGHVYCHRSSRERNQEVKRFWQAKIAEP